MSPILCDRVQSIRRQFLRSAEYSAPRLRRNDALRKLLIEGEIDPTNPLFNKVCVFTGALETMTRAAASQMVLNCGGECGSSVTKKTNYLILGNMDYCSNIKDGKSAKQKKAEELKLAGQDIDIIPENVFLDLLQE